MQPLLNRLNKSQQLNEARLEMVSALFPTWAGCVHAAIDHNFSSLRSDLVESLPNCCITATYRNGSWHLADLSWCWHLEIARSLGTLFDCSVLLMVRLGIQATTVHLASILDSYQGNVQDHPPGGGDTLPELIKYSYQRVLPCVGTGSSHAIRSICTWPGPLTACQKFSFSRESCDGALLVV